MRLDFSGVTFVDAMGRTGGRLERGGDGQLF
jgi:hypothetical protein